MSSPRLAIRSISFCDELTTTAMSVFLSQSSCSWSPERSTGSRFRQARIQLLEGKPQPVRQKKLAFRLAPLGALAASGKAAELRPKVCGLPAEFLKKVDGRLFDEVAFRKAPIKGRALLVGNIARAGT